jgi:hypothetical protein
VCLDSIASVEILIPLGNKAQDVKSEAAYQEMTRPDLEAMYCPNIKP